MKLVVIVVVLLGTALAAPSEKAELRELLRELLEVEEKQEPLVLAQHGVGEALVGSSLEKRRSYPAIKVQTITAYDKNGNKKQMTVKDMCLHAHNTVRALHENTPPLEYDAELAEGAANWAKRIAFTGELHPEKDRQGNGENIFCSATYSSLGTNAESAVSSPAEAVFSWYKESWKVNGMDQPYDYTSENNPGTGNFAQVVWKGSSKVGCGVATIYRHPWQKTCISARYQEAGNKLGTLLENVLPLKQGAQRPENYGSLVDFPGCLNYGVNCDSLSAAAQCSIEVIGDKCPCTCS